MFSVPFSNLVLLCMSSVTLAILAASTITNAQVYVSGIPRCGPWHDNLACPDRIDSLGNPIAEQYCSKWGKLIVNHFPMTHTHMHTVLTDLVCFLFQDSATHRISTKSLKRPVSSWAGNTIVRLDVHLEQPVTSSRISIVHTPVWMPATSRPPFNAFIQQRRAQLRRHAHCSLQPSHHRLLLLNKRHLRLHPIIIVILSWRCSLTVPWPFSSLLSLSWILRHCKTVSSAFVVVGVVAAVMVVAVVPLIIICITRLSRETQHSMMIWRDNNNPNSEVWLQSWRLAVSLFLLFVWWLYSHDNDSCRCASRSLY